MRSSEICNLKSPWQSGRHQECPLRAPCSAALRRS
jgi:hypothetical protein